MAKTGERIKARVVEVIPSRIEKDSFSGKRYETGNYCVVECDGWAGSYNMVNGSVAQVAQEDRVVGREGWLEWTSSGFYNGPVWRSQRMVEESAKKLMEG